jgi:hypothetical protein
MLRHRRRSVPDEHVGSASTCGSPLGPAQESLEGWVEHHSTPARCRRRSAGRCAQVPSERQWPLSLLAPVVLERDTEPDAKIHDGAVLDRQVLAHNLGHA